MIILKRTFMVYIITAIVLLKFVNFNLVHSHYLNGLMIETLVTNGENIDTDINYWEYKRCLNPDDLKALTNLAIYFLLTKDTSNAQSTLNKALCISPPDYPGREALLKTFKILKGNTEIHCGKWDEDFLIAGYPKSPH